MIKIPATNWQQANNSDRFGNISSTRNINFDSEGYLTLASRSFSVYSNDNTYPDFDNEVGTVLAIGRYALGKFTAVTSDANLSLSLSNTVWDEEEDAE